MHHKHESCQRLVPWCDWSAHFPGLPSGNHTWQWENLLFCCSTAWNGHLGTSQPCCDGSYSNLTWHSWVASGSSTNLSAHSAPNVAGSARSGSTNWSSRSSLEAAAMESSGLRLEFGQDMARYGKIASKLKSTENGFTCLLGLGNTCPDNGGIATQSPPPASAANLLMPAV